MRYLPLSPKTSTDARAPIEETHEFSCLFTDRALLKAQFSREGTGVWGAEVTERPFIAYIEGIRVEPEYRGQGVGRWALERLLEVKDPYFGVRTIFPSECSRSSS